MKNRPEKPAEKEFIVWILTIAILLGGLCWYHAVDKRAILADHLRTQAYYTEMAAKFQAKQ